jgi:hypothetical protein
MKKMIGVMIALACVAAHAQDTVVSGDEIKAKWAGKKLFTRGANGQLADFALMVDGSASISTNNFSDTGTWRPWEKGYCAKWQKIRQGAEACFTVLRRGSDIVILNPDGSTSGQILRGLD